MGRSRYRPFRRMSGAVDESTGEGEDGTKRGTPVDDNRQGEALRNVLWKQHKLGIPTGI